MKGKKDEKKEEESDDEEEEEEEDDSEDEKAPEKVNDKKENINNKEEKKESNVNKISESKSLDKSKNLISKNSKSKNSISIDNKSKENNKNKVNNISNKYTENDIIENAGFKIEKSSRNTKEEQIDNKKEENPFEEKLIPDSPEIRNLRIHAAKIRNEFPQWSKIEEPKGGDLAVKCWNCGNINICNSKFKVIQCPVCHENNEVPKIMDRIDELLMLAKANTCTTYADINHTVPLVNYIVVCPYCKCDNKVRETACFCICYMCKNKWTIRRPDAEKVQEEKKRKPPKQRGLEGNYYKYDSKTGRILPPDRPMRFSDLFYPDPMFYPGYYPINSLSPLYPEYFTPYDDYRYIDRQEKTIKYFDRVNQQKKLLEKFGNILEDDKMKNKNNEKDIKPYYHLNYEDNIEKKDILRQLEDLDRKSENLMKNRIFPNDKNNITQNSIKTIKSRYDDKESSVLYEKTNTSQRISSMRSGMEYNQVNKNNKLQNKNNNTNSISKSNTLLSNDKSLNQSGTISKMKNKRSSMGELSSKYKSIEDTYFMKEN